MTSELSGYTTLPEPELMFAGNKAHMHPLVGLLRCGPYGLKYGAPATLRLALLAPKLHMQKLRGLVAELGKTAKPREAVKYYPDYPGFENVFRIPVAPLEDGLVFPFPDDLERFAARQQKLDLARGLLHCINQLGNVRSNFDVALIYLPPSWALLRRRELRFPRLPEGVLRTVQHPCPDPTPGQF